MLIFSLILVVTLTSSGAAKLKDYTSTATAIFNLKIDRWIPIRARTAALILPWAELLLALALLVAPGILQIIAALCALLLFAFYWVIIARAVMSGNDASCNCFGSTSAAPISQWTLARNTALVIAAAVVVAGALAYGRSPASMFFSLTLEQGFWLFGAALAVITVWFIYRSEMISAPATTTALPSTATVNAPTSADASAENEGLSSLTGRTPYTNTKTAEDIVEEDYIRLPIPFGQITEISLHGNIPHNLRELASRQARVLIWVSPTCGPCLDVIAKIGQWQEKLGSTIGVHPVISSEASLENLAVPENITVFIDEGGNTQRNFGGGTPTAVALGTDELMAGGPVYGKGAVIDFMNDLLAEFDVA